jgi:hypothetical protein
MSERRSREVSLIRLTVIEIGRAFLGKPLQLQDFSLALEELQKQHEKVLPTVPEGKSMQWVLFHRPELIDQAEEMARKAIGRGEVARGLQIANHLYAYSEVALQDSYPSRAFEHSLNVHRQLSGYILEKHSGTDQQRSLDAIRLLASINEAREKQDFYTELATHRTFIHSSALGGHLGQEIREYFDPTALIPLDKI